MITNFTAISLNHFADLLHQETKEFDSLAVHGIISSAYHSHHHSLRYARPVKKREKTHKTKSRITDKSIHFKIRADLFILS